MTTTESIFWTARDLSPDDRRSFLAQACGDDAELRKQVDALLAADADADADSFLSLESASRFEGEHAAGDQIGRYTLLKEIGSGGFGSVWLAEQSEPVERRVAIKIIKLGMDTRQVIARFEAERQAIAMMDHPNIARVLDAGATEAGRPFFVMELVDGRPIVEFCNEHRLDIRARLELFIGVCHAVQHAHQKGIIHRDIKPSNVLTSMHDGTPVPKIIDFGIAKATRVELTQKTLITARGQLIGSPAYMSPEQLTMSELEIDTRSDVYGLGVLLYEMLTGTRPFPGDELDSKGLAELVRVLTQEDPPKPSARVLNMDEADRAAGPRPGDPHRVASQLRGDLDWIAMKCLEKDRERRYDTANGLAVDIRRHLNDEPVLAGPPNASYRMQKFVRRNRAGVVAASLVAGAVLAGGGLAGGGLLWALSEKARVERAEESTRRQLTRATEVKQLITSMLASVRPEDAGSADTPMLRSILDKTVARLDAGEIEDRMVQAELRTVTGDAYGSLGDFLTATSQFEAALELYRDELGAEHENTLNIARRLGVLYFELARYDEAESLIAPVYRTYLETLGARSQDARLAAVNLGGVYQKQARYDEAESLFRGVIDMEGEGEEFEKKTHNAIRNLASLYVQTRRFDEALPLFEQTVAWRLEKYGPEYPDTLRSIEGLGTLYIQLQRFDEAEQMLGDVLEPHRQVFGETHPDTLTVVNNLGALYLRSGRPAQAKPLFKISYDAKRERLGERHPETLRSLNNISGARFLLGEYEAALESFEEMLVMRTEALGPDHVDSIRSAGMVAMCHDRLGNIDEAYSAYSDMIEASIRTLGEEHYVTRTAMNNMALMLAPTGRVARAVEVSRRVAELEEATGRPNYEYIDTHAQALFHAGEFAEAIEVQRRVLEIMPPGADDTAFDRLAEYEIADEHGDEIESWTEAALGVAHARRGLEVRTEMLGPDAPATLAAMVALAEAFVAAEQIDEATETIARAKDVARTAHGEPSEPLEAVLRGAGAVWYDAKQHERAEPEYRELSQLLESSDRGDTQAGLAARARHTHVLAWLDRLGEARTVIDRLPELSARVGEERAAVFVPAMERLVERLRQRGELDAAIGYCHQAIELLTNVHGPDSTPVANVQHRLSVVLSDANELTEAVRISREALATHRLRSGDRSREVATTLYNLGLLLMKQRRFEDVHAAHGESLSIFRELHGDDHPRTWKAMIDLGLASIRSGRSAEGEALYRDVIIASNREVGPGSPQALHAMNNLAYHYAGTDRAREGLDMITEVVHLQAEAGEESFVYLDTMAYALFKAGRIREALETQRRVVELLPEGGDPTVFDRLAQYEDAASRLELVSNGTK
ncbi:MAG: tetratricopeptide repeat protein [Planctomycetota bacterium]